MKRKQLLLGLGLVVLVVALVATYYYYFHHKPADSPAAAAGGTTDGHETSSEAGAGATAAEAKPSVFPLKPGSSGHEVGNLQAFLVREHGAQFPDGITSAYDGHTDEAVRKHLRRNRVSADYYQKVGMGAPYSPAE